MLLRILTDIYNPIFCSRSNFVTAGISAIFALLFPLWCGIIGLSKETQRPCAPTTYKETTMENENLIPEEEETSILTLTDENGQETDFEYLDCIEYQGKEYLVLMPADELATEIIILEVEPVDEENENYLSVNDEKLLNEVYAIFKERYKDILTFEEE